MGRNRSPSAGIPAWRDDVAVPVSLSDDINQLGSPRADNFYTAKHSDGDFSFG